ncbi:MAG: hypothetical protein P8I92_04365 [Schleiferiaceae bacterium]|nr:hypothetical protein [Schleiferiaceae bacterium]
MRLLTTIAALLISISAFSQEKKSNQDGLIESVEELSSLEKDTGSNISLGDIEKSSSSKRGIEINTRPFHYLVGSINTGTEYRAYKGVSVVLDGSYGRFLWGGPVTSVMGGIRYYFQESPELSFFVSVKHRSGFYASDAFYGRLNPSDPYPPTYGRRNTLMLGLKQTTARHFTAAYEIGIQNQDFYIYKASGNAFDSFSVNRVSGYFSFTLGYK